MSGVDREQTRVKATGEVFTPLGLVQNTLNLIDKKVATDITKTFLDPTCGDGQFLTEVLIRRLESFGKEEITDTEFEQALSNIYGVDLMIDNVDVCRKRLLCGSTNLQHIAIVEKNIYQYNALEFNYEFEPMSKIRLNKERLLRSGFELTES